MRDTAEVIVHSPRITERRRAVRAERRRRRFRIALACCLVASLAFGGWSLTRSRLFQLDRIDVVGAPGIDRTQILAAAGLRIGSPAIGLDLNQIAERVRAMDAVEQVRVVRTGTLSLRIEVEARRAAIVVRTADARLLLDKHGEQVLARRGKGLPVIDDPRSRVTALTVSQVLSIWRHLSKRERRRVDSFVLTKAGIAARMGDSKIVFGTPEHIKAKVQALRLLRARLRQEGSRLVAVDLRAPNRPAVRVA